MVFQNKDPRYDYEADWNPQMKILVSQRSDGPTKYQGSPGNGREIKNKPNDKVELQLTRNWFLEKIQSLQTTEMISWKIQSLQTKGINT